MERRKDIRNDETDSLKGRLYNVVHFKVQDISRSGLNIVCGLMTNIGAIYNIYLNKDNEKKDFKIKITRTEALPINEEHGDIKSDGLLFTVGAEFLEMNKERSEFLDFIIDKDDIFNGGFVIDK